LLAAAALAYDYMGDQKEVKAILKKAKEFS
jgi:hypothetical protein